MAQNPIEQLEQLLISLDVLSERESTLVRDKLWSQAEELQQRMLALVEAIIPIAQDLKHRGLLPQKLSVKIAVIMAKQSGTFDERGKAMKEVQSEIKESKTKGAKLNTLRPVYVKSTLPRNGSGGSSLDARG